MKRPNLARPPEGQELGLVKRVFAVLAAVFLVSGVALASLLPPDISLFQTLAAIHAVRPDRLQHMVTAVFGHFVWASLAVPLLVRPVWLIPVAFGLICVGGAVTALNQAAPRATKRRS